MIETAKEDAVRMREYRQSLRDEYEDYEDYEDYDDYEAEEDEDYETPIRKEKAHSKRSKRVREEKSELPKENVRRMDKRARGVVSSSAITLKAGMPQNTGRQDIHEIVLLDEEMGAADAGLFEEIKVQPYHEAMSPEGADTVYTETEYTDTAYAEEEYTDTADIETQYPNTEYMEPADADSGFSEMEYAAYSEELYAEEVDGFTDNTETDSEMADYFTDNPGVSAERSFWDGFDAVEYDAEAINSMPEPVTEDTVLPQPVAEQSMTAEAQRTPEQQEAVSEAGIQLPMTATEQHEEAPKPYFRFIKKRRWQKRRFGESIKGDSAAFTADITDFWRSCHNHRYLSGTFCHKV